jgi:hypothetical protein
MHRIIHLSTERGMSRRALSSVSFDHLSIDEKSFKKGHKYITVLSHPASGCVLEVEEGRSKKSCKSLFDRRSAEKCNYYKYGHVEGIYHYKQKDASSRADNYLKEGDTVSFGNSALEVIFVPGHAPGHICLVNKKDKYIIGGDVLFYGSIGRTDLPGGDHATLIKSIRVKIFNLDDDFRVYTGHGPATNIGFEKINNPFFGLNA